MAAVPFAVHVAPQDQVEEAEGAGLRVPVRDAVAGLAVVAAGAEVLQARAFLPQNGQLALADMCRTTRQCGNLPGRERAAPRRHMVDEAPETTFEFTIYVARADQERQRAGTSLAERVLFVHQCAVDPQFEFRPGHRKHDVVPFGRPDQSDGKIDTHDRVHHILLERIGPALLRLESANHVHSCRVRLFGAPDRFDERCTGDRARPEWTCKPRLDCR